jgi:hypothetical protein
MTAVSPVTKAARQAQIADILTRARVRSQEELADRLAQRGVKVTQATLSRDLEELGAVRLRGTGGTLVYALPGDPGGPGSRPGGLPGSPAETQPGPPGSPPGAWLSRRVDEGASGTLARVGPELLLSAEASANPGGGSPVPRLRHRPCRLAVHPRHGRGRRHRPGDQPGARRRERGRGEPAPPRGAQGLIDMRPAAQFAVAAPPGG